MTHRRRITRSKASLRIGTPQNRHWRRSPLGDLLPGPVSRRGVQLVGGIFVLLDVLV